MEEYSYHCLFTQASNIPAWNLIGARLLKVEKGEAQVGLPFRPELANSQGVLQGGFITAIADAAGGNAIRTLLKPDALITTIELKVNFFRAVKEDVVAFGRALYCGQRIGTSFIEVKTDADAVAAVGTATYYFKNI